MNFKNLKLGTKLGIGFGILILISAILGGLSVFNMSRVTVRSNYLAREYVPEVNISNDIERSSLQAMYQTRGYSFTEEKSYLDAARQALNELQSNLINAHDLAKSSTQLVQLNASVDQVDENVARFDNILKDLEQTNQNIATERTNMDAGAANLVNSCNAYLQSQNESFDQEISGGRTSAGSLKERQNKITLINTIISQAHELRVANFKAQATRDSDALQQALDDFDISNDMKKIRSYTRQQSDIIQLDNIEKAASTYLQAMENYLTHFKKREALTKQLDDAGNQVNTSSVAIAEAGISNTEDIALGAVSLLKTSSTVMIVGLFIAMLLGILLAVIITRAITVPIRKGVVFAKEIAEGNLMAQIDVDQQDEVGQLSDALRNMANRLKEIVTNILTGAENIASASQQMSGTSQEMSQGATEQASSAEEVSSSMEEMASNIQQNTDNAQQTEQIAMKATDGIKEGSKSTDISVKSMKEIAAKITIINDIAFQTNILALNAAVEAARAGEHGKGFAVVAAEVRKLAERSKIAADEIDDLSRDGVAISEKAGRQLAEIVPEIEKTARLVQEITAASMEQNAGSDQINSAIQQLNQVTQQNAAASEEMATSSEELASQAEQLKDIIAYFKIDHTSGRKNPGVAVKKATAHAPNKVAHLSHSLTKERTNGKGADLKMYSADDKDTEFEKF